MAARRHLEKNKKATVSAASGSVTALSPKSVTKFQNVCNMMLLCGAPTIAAAKR
jgi:hypothetical protein